MVTELETVFALWSSSRDYFLTRILAFEAFIGPIDTAPIANIDFRNRVGRLHV